MVGEFIGQFSWRTKSNQCQQNAKLLRALPIATPRPMLNSASFLSSGKTSTSAGCNPPPTRSRSATRPTNKTRYLVQTRHRQPKTFCPSLADERKMAGSPRKTTFLLQRGGKRKGPFFGPFCTFWTRVAITAPRRPKRTRPGSKAVWVLGNQLVAGFARRFGLLERQHVRWRAHMCPFQDQKKVPLGGEAIREHSHVSQPIFARKRCFRSRHTG